MKVIITGSKKVKDLYLVQTACFNAVKRWHDYIREVVVLKDTEGAGKLGKQLAKFAEIPIKILNNIEEMTDYADGLVIINEDDDKEIKDLRKMAKKKGLSIYVFGRTS